MSNFIHVTPFMHVDNLERALTFFTDILGFETPYRLANYAYVQRETVGFRILEEKGDDGAPPGNRRFAYYIIDASPTILTFTTSISSIRNSSRNSTPCPVEMFTGR